MFPQGTVLSKGGPARNRLLELNLIIDNRRSYELLSRRQALISRSWSLPGKAGRISPGTTSKYSNNITDRTRLSRRRISLGTTRKQAYTSNITVRTRLQQQSKTYTAAPPLTGELSN